MRETEAATQGASPPKRRPISVAVKSHVTNARGDVEEKAVSPPGAVIDPMATTGLAGFGMPLEPPGEKLCATAKPTWLSGDCEKMDRVGAKAKDELLMGSSTAVGAGCPESLPIAGPWAGGNG